MIAAAAVAKAATRGGRRLPDVRGYTRWTASPRPLSALRTTSSPLCHAAVEPPVSRLREGDGDESALIPNADSTLPAPWYLDLVPSLLLGVAQQSQRTGSG